MRLNGEISSGEEEEEVVVVEKSEAGTTPFLGQNVVVGYALTAKKKKSFLQPNFIALARYFLFYTFIIYLFFFFQFAHMVRDFFLFCCDNFMCFAFWFLCRKVAFVWWGSWSLTRNVFVCVISV